MRRKKLSVQEIKNIENEKCDYASLDDNGKEFYHVVNFRKKACEESFVYLKNLVQQDIDNLIENDHYFIKGFEKDDINQECYIMLVKAAEAFDPLRGGDFRSYCRLLFKGRLISLLQESRRYKNIVINYSCSLSQPVFSDQEGNVITYEDLVSSNDFDFLDQLCLNEYYKNTIDKLDDGLSDLESGVYKLYLDGMSYREGSDSLGINKKSFGNAVQRVKSKISIIFEDEIKKEENNRKDKRKIKKRNS